MAQPLLFQTGTLLGLEKPRPLGGVRVIWLCLKNVFEIAVAEGHESGEKPRPLAVDSPIQVISLLKTFERIISARPKTRNFSQSLRQAQIIILEILLEILNVFLWL